MDDRRTYIMFTAGFGFVWNKTILFWQVRYLVVLTRTLQCRNDIQC